MKTIQVFTLRVASGNPLRPSMVFEWPPSGRPLLRPFSSLRSGASVVEPVAQCRLLGVYD
ncbi:MAG: hypothetical protein JW863_14520 [Chitinispirillaceae bacterium]|nr:hypothetical protein [Chitinispirillaceae bacterium]